MKGCVDSAKIGSSPSREFKKSDYIHFITLWSFCIKCCCLHAALGLCLSLRSEFWVIAAAALGLQEFSAGFCPDTPQASVFMGPAPLSRGMISGSASSPIHKFCKITSLLLWPCATFKKAACFSGSALRKRVCSRQPLPNPQEGVAPSIVSVLIYFEKSWALWRRA